MVVRLNLPRRDVPSGGGWGGFKIRLLIPAITESPWMLGGLVLADFRVESPRMLGGPEPADFRGESPRMLGGPEPADFRGESPRMLGGDALSGSVDRTGTGTGGWGFQPGSGPRIG